MAPRVTVDLSKGLARQLRAVRVQQRLPQGDVADRARGLGLEWDRDTVAKIETGHRELKLVEFLLLPLILACPLADLFPPGGLVPLTPSVALTTDQLTRLLRGDLIPVDLSRVVKGAKRLIQRDALREAERKAAKRLGLDPIELSTLAHKRWGMGLTEKRDQLLTEEARAGDLRSRQALRGWVTRQLDKELTDKEAPE